jgi:hypothetical protein
MPRCGTMFTARAMPWMTQCGRAHDGWWALHEELRSLPTYVLVREPLSWYLSLFEYEKKHGSQVWLRYFGINRTDPFGVALERFTGTHIRIMPEGRVDGHWMAACDPIHAMASQRMGLWSWWVLRMCSIDKEVQGPSQELAPVRFLWLTEHRNQDLIKLSSICGKRPRLEAGRNGVPHPPVEEVYSDRLRHLVIERDSEVLHRALSLESGITVTDT